MGQVVGALPAGIDLLLPADAAGLGRALVGYGADLLVIYGFNWILPREVFEVPRFGAINVHTSLLPKYRGPAPVLWAIRNGDPDIGVTIHRVDEGIDTGPILAQQDGIPLDEEVTPERLRDRIGPVIQDLLATALARVASGASGQPQPTEGLCHAGLLESEFFQVDWSRPARDIHNQVRVFRFIGSGDAPVARVGDRWLRLVLDPGQFCQPVREPDVVVIAGRDLQGVFNRGAGVMKAASAAVSPGKQEQRVAFAEAVTQLHQREIHDLG